MGFIGKLFHRTKSWEQVATDEMSETPDQRDAEEKTYEARGERVSPAAGPGAPWTSDPRGPRHGATQAEIDADGFERDSEDPVDPDP
jgi:hypothetical protein